MPVAPVPPRFAAPLTRARRTAALLLALAGPLAGCGSGAWVADTGPAMVYAPIAQAGIADERQAYRQVFCALREAEADCERLLRRYADEPAAGTASLPPFQRRHAEVVIVTGLFGECLTDVPTFGDAVPRLAELGYRVTHAPVHGRASAAVNAAVVRDHVRARAAAGGGKVIVLSFSKGTVDTMTALVQYPDLAERVAAVVSFAGAVNGSPLADRLAGWYAATFAQLPYAACPVRDGGEMAELTRARRTAWNAANPLPAGPRYYSIVAAPEPKQVSTIFRGMYEDLARFDPRNDGQVIHSDAIVPGSTLLAYANVDHFGIAFPFAAHAPVLARTLIDRTEYPRSALVEAAVRIVESAPDGEAAR